MSQRSAMTPPRRTKTAWGSVSAPSTTPAITGESVCTAVQASATMHTASPNHDSAMAATQIWTIRSRVTGGGAAPISVG